MAEIIVTNGSRTVIVNDNISSDIIEVDRVSLLFQETLRSEVIETTGGTEIIEVVQQGLPGVNGTDGDKFYKHIQGVAGKTWSVVHNLNKFPSVTIVDSAGSVVEGCTDMIDNNNLIITFNSSFSGTAYLN